MAFRPGNLLVVGAGFSFNAGLPLATDFTNELLNVEGLKLTGPSASHVKFVRKFADDVFGEGESHLPDQWPDLEEIFTLIDLAANTGHNLGRSYSASDLRVVRRAMIVRTIRMLSQAYFRKQRNPDSNWKQLESFFENFNAETSAVLSMNWDMVFERGISRTQSIRNIDYECGARGCVFENKKISLKPQEIGKEARILKPHGSVNWLYCDACREMFWVPPGNTEQIAQTLFKKSDWIRVLGKAPPKSVTALEPLCPHCQSKALGTRFATFSFRKALDFPMHSSSWRAAEEYMKCAYDWVFIGYSMPFADFEFKSLLKRVQLSNRNGPRITVITGGSGAKETIGRFKKFFGDVSGERIYFENGLDNKALFHLKKIDVLREY